MSESDNE